jgi:hypothetical protein
MPRPRYRDPVEQEYEDAIRMARSDEDAFELSIGFKQYREMYQDRWYYLEPTHQQQQGE